MVKIRGTLDEDELRRLRAGTVVDGHHVKPLNVEPVRKSAGGGSTWWRIEVTEGRTHEVRQLFFRAGRLVQRLRRSAIGPVKDGTLRAGEFRTLTADEIESLRRAAGEKPKVARAKRARQHRPAKRSGRAKRSGKPAKRR
jgi:23S rRNA pseudouridine2605 synthase